MKFNLKPILLPALFLFNSIALAADSSTGLEIDQPETLTIVYTIEPEEVDEKAIQTMLETLVSEAGIKIGQRDDAQLFARVEKHAGEYLIYLDFNRELYFHANGRCYRTKGFVWGRYANNVTDQDEITEDLAFFIEEFLDQYRRANQLK
ncbi:hypothetical protein [Methylophaga sp.]|uniref:hypothetical protein n=1 Tax=Methylophaga sp. TaxID=2024840 RepID=UPI00140124E4|nr:hypothetical protein [Methylophaga sp.]MTI62488.1 hypothetical protein [Methylophaga sp.]